MVSRRARGLQGAASVDAVAQIVVPVGLDGLDKVEEWNGIHYQVRQFVNA
jgi:hypothetical protein